MGQEYRHPHSVKQHSCCLTLLVYVLLVVGSVIECSTRVVTMRVLIYFTEPGGIEQKIKVEQMVGKRTWTLSLLCWGHWGWNAQFSYPNIRDGVCLDLLKQFWNLSLHFLPEKVSTAKCWLLIGCWSMIRPSQTFLPEKYRHNLAVEMGTHWHPQHYL